MGPQQPNAPLAMPNLGPLFDWLFNSITQRATSQLPHIDTATQEAMTRDEVTQALARLPLGGNADAKLKAVMQACNRFAAVCTRLDDLTRRVKELQLEHSALVMVGHHVSQGRFDAAMEAVREREERPGSLVHEPAFANCRARLGGMGRRGLREGEKVSSVFLEAERDALRAERKAWQAQMSARSAAVYRKEGELKLAMEEEKECEAIAAGYRRLAVALARVI